MKMTAFVRQQIHDWLQDHREEMMADIAALVAIDSARGEEKEGMPYGEGPYRAFSQIFSVRFGHLGVPGSTIFGGSFAGCVIEIDQTKALVIALAPLKIIQQ